MSHARAVILIAGLCALAACASPPYSKSGTDREVAMADYQDCYSKGSLDHLTPESKASISASTRACMQARGYRADVSFPWW